MAETITSSDIHYAGSGAISRFVGAGCINFYHTKMKNGHRSYKWVMIGVQDEQTAERIVEAVKRKLVGLGLDVVKAFVATTELRGGPGSGDDFGVRIWIDGL